jgi:hypothetical protein
MRDPSRTDGGGHLTYCTNIHAGETWPDLVGALRRNVPAIRRKVAEGQPFGLGLRLGAEAAEALRHEAAFEELRSFLETEDAYVFTINGFPYGNFHGRRVKEDVYAPDWSRPERVAYTEALADLLARLLPPGMRGSISTVPGTFGAWAPGRIEAIVQNLVGHAAYLDGVRATTGAEIALALEPEPCCLLETVEEAARFFERELYGDASVRQMAELRGLSRGAAADALHRHLGLCYDVCHAAVEFEDPLGGLDRLAGAGVPIAKLQLSSALKVDRLTGEAAGRLRPFDEGVYLHQVVARRNGETVRYLDLGPAFADLDRTLGGEWRVHFHVPVFLAEMEHFSTTQDFLRDILAIHRRRPISDHLEVETYTWDVLPAQYRDTPVADAIARELDWVKGRLAP